jgi:hemoglobin
VADIRTRDDVELLLRDFYGRVFQDPLLRHVFVDVAHMDLEQHLPVLVGFWQKVLFNTGSYDGRAMEVHRRIHSRSPLTGEHFTRWLRLWREALDACFCGPVTEQADAHARRMAAVFLRNLTRTEPRRSLPVVPSAQSAPASRGQEPLGLTAS